MKGLFLVLIIIAFIINYSYKIVTKKVRRNFIYVIGVYKHSIVDKKFASNIIDLAHERDIAMIVKEYDNYFILLRECNSYDIDFAILPEDFYVDSCLGLNVFKEQRYINNQYMISLYFNYMYLISAVVYIDTSKNQKFTTFSQILNFRKVYSRNYIIGTESSQSNSYSNLILILSVYGITPINIDDIEDIEYEDNVIFYKHLSKSELHKYMLNKKVDGIFVMDIQNSRFVSTIMKTTNSLFINFDFENTIFDDVFSNYYSKKKLGINNFYTNDTDTYFQKNNRTPKDKITYYNDDDLNYSNTQKPVDLDKSLKNIMSNIGEFDTRSIRTVLVSNDQIDKEIVYKITELILRNNNFLINKVLYNKFSNTEHDLFEPIDIIYIDKNIRYHEGSRKLYEEMKFITFDKDELTKMEADSEDKFDVYWNYSKIGLNNFKFKEDDSIE
tara:strand:- start:992 stop:2317 length:1326 start_codon:yes stop_codon:yes gene_type:complete